jgi:hypothetical protein
MKPFISRSIIGLSTLAVGVILLLDALGVADTGSFLRDWWPSLIVIGGVAMLIGDTKNYMWALLIMIIGVVTQVRVLGLTDINLWQLFWPLALIVIGLSIMLRRSDTTKRTSVSGSDDTIAILGGTDQVNTSEEFTSSKVTALLGGAKLDLRKAVIKQAATIEVFTLMGGIELFVPRGVIVKNRTNVILGGVENKTDQEVTKNSPVLTIVGDVVMGGVEIKN